MLYYVVVCVLLFVIVEYCGEWGGFVFVGVGRDLIMIVVRCCDKFLSLCMVSVWKVCFGWVSMGRVC